MTDNEIIKAFEHCFVNGRCNGCPLEDDAGGSRCRSFPSEMLDFIKCRKAEIERKDRSLESYALQYGTVTDKEVFLRKARDEAIKEFAERLKAEIRDVMFAYPAREHCERIDNLVKEMTKGDTT